MLAAAAAAIRLALMQAAVTAAPVAQPEYDRAQETALYQQLVKRPDSARISYALGNMILLEKKVARQEEGLFYIVRAAFIQGDDPLAEGHRDRLRVFLRRTHTNYRGEEGFGQWVATAIKPAIDRRDFRIPQTVCGF